MSRPTPQAIARRKQRYREDPEFRAKMLSYNKIRRATDPAYRVDMTVRTRAHEFARKVAALDAYGGLVCVCCGEQHIAFLTLDHVNNDGAEHRRRIKAEIGAYAAGPKFYLYLKRNNYPQDPPLQVLCYNCNCGKRANEGVCPHRDGR